METWLLLMAKSKLFIVFILYYMKYVTENHFISRNMMLNIEHLQSRNRLSEKIIKSNTLILQMFLNSAGCYPWGVFIWLHGTIMLVFTLNLAR